MERKEVNGKKGTLIDIGFQKEFVISVVTEILSMSKKKSVTTYSHQLEAFKETELQSRQIRR